MTITSLNLFVLACWVANGQPRTVLPAERTHLLRCIQAGLVTTTMTLTPAGRAALDANPDIACLANRNH